MDFTFLSDPVLAGFLAASVRMSIPIMLVALGGMLSERAGVLNIGLEGMMLAGCFFGFIAAYYTGNLWLGVLAAALVGGFIGLILAVFAIWIHSNQVIVGIAINLLMLGVTSFVFRLAFSSGASSPRIDSFPKLEVDWLTQIPILGPVLFFHDALTYISILVVGACWLLFYRSTFGTAIIATGEHPEAAETLGIKVRKVRLLSVCASGALAGVGGAFLSLSATGLFMDNMTAGRGYIALAILILGRRHPIGILAASLLFGASEALQLRAQLIPIGIPLQFLLMLPYVLTIVALAGFSRMNTAPASLGEPYKRSSDSK